MVFAAIAILVLMKSGGNVDMSGEKHGIDASHTGDSGLGGQRACFRRQRRSPAASAAASATSN